jgi:hypothetical protein
MVVHGQSCTGCPQDDDKAQNEGSPANEGFKAKGQTGRARQSR